MQRCIHNWMTLTGILYHNQNNYSIHYLTSNAHPKNKIHYVINICKFTFSGTQFKPTLAHFEDGSHAYTI